MHHHYLCRLRRLLLGAVLLSAVGALHSAQPVDYRGQLGQAQLAQALQQAWSHESLLAETSLLAVLQQALRDGLLTGYDLRRAGAFSELDQSRTLIYSHNSAQHLQELCDLLARHQLNASVYLTPKISAFLYRDNWGKADESVRELAPGLRVMQGREAAVAFEFDRSEQRTRFHQLVERYAKRDTTAQQGLITDAWWQPFYYSATAIADFEQIGLIIVSTPQVEATLTVLPARVNEVMQALANSVYPLDAQTVWVNPAFFRFLQGDYR